MSKRIVKITVKDFGDIRLELYPDYAPITVDNFINLVNDNFYDGLIFHRIIRGFMIQGGGGRKAETIKGEFISNGVNNPLKHERGVISMARTMVKDSATSQFFIMHKDAKHLDGEYAAFGKMIDGFDCLDKIASVETDQYDKPLVDVIIEKIILE
ncbi:MAG: peptidylprolyl isomerase [Acholeplasma sp.]|nr:peptidylprolyl isomerase [Acholeplasma sp.]